MKGIFFYILIEAIIVASLAFYVVNVIKRRKLEKTPKVLKFEEDSIFLAEQKYSRDFINNLTRFRLMGESLFAELKFFLVVIVALFLFLLFCDLILKISDINIINKITSFIKYIFAFIFGILKLLCNFTGIRRDV